MRLEGRISYYVDTVEFIIKKIVETDPLPWDHFYKSLKYNEWLWLWASPPNHWGSPVVLQQLIFQRIVFSGFDETWSCFLFQAVYSLSYDPLLFQRDWPSCIYCMFCVVFIVYLCTLCDVLVLPGYLSTGFSPKQTTELNQTNPPASSNLQLLGKSLIPAVIATLNSRPCWPIWPT